MQKNDIYKQLLFSDKPSDYFIFLKNSNFLSDFPEIYSLIITPQNPKWHPEGSVWTHTLMVIDNAAEYRYLYSDEQSAAAFMFAALCHDFGKPYTTRINKQSIASPMHDSLGIAPARSFLSKLALYHIEVEVCNFIIEHLKPSHLYNDRNNVSDKAIVKLSQRINIYDLVNLCRCDHWGRTDADANNKIFPAGDWLMSRYNAILTKGL